MAKTLVVCEVTMSTNVSENACLGHSKVMVGGGGKPSGAMLLLLLHHLRPIRQDLTLDGQPHSVGVYRSSRKQSLRARPSEQFSLDSFAASGRIPVKEVAGGML